MKRPEGFDPEPPPPEKPQRGRAPKAPKQPRDERPSARPTPNRVEADPVGTERTAPVRKPPRERAARPAKVRASQRPEAIARTELRKAARERRRYERHEVRRFTRRARNRRIALAVVSGIIVTLIGLVLIAVYSPLLALRTITVDGTSRVDAAQVQEAISGQLGTPLALVDFGRMEDELADFPLIRSYVTETLPPDTIRVHIVERQPVGSIRTADGSFELVDPAGISVQEAAERVPGVPFIEVAEAPSEAFESVVEVLLALPPDLLAQVDTAAATTQDDVSLVLTGIGQRVRWGSADDSAQKATLLTTLIGVTDPALPGEFDVSAPNNGIFRQAG